MLWLLIRLIKLYRLLFSPWVGHSCRYHPTCSQYAQDALQEHGCWRGSWLTLKRLVRCGPWSKPGYDPVPPKIKKEKVPHESA